MNRSTIRRPRICIRKHVAAIIKESFTSEVLLTVHRDGKMLPDLTGKDKVDRLPILVSGTGVTKQLGVPKRPSETGKVMTEALLGRFEDWGITHRVQAMSFDKTSSNTGCMIGACILIELQVGRYLLHLACRHHIMEIVAERSFRKHATFHPLVLTS